MKSLLVVFLIGLSINAWSGAAMASAPRAKQAVPRVPPPVRFGPEQTLDKWGVAFRAPVGATIADVIKDETHQSIQITDAGENYVLFVVMSSEVQAETLDEMDAQKVGLMVAPGHLERVSKLTKIKFAGYNALKFEWRDWNGKPPYFPKAKIAGTLILIEVKPKQFFGFACLGKDDDSKTGWQKYSCGVCAQFLRRVRVSEPV